MDVERRVIYNIPHCTVCSKKKKRKENTNPRSKCCYSQAGPRSAAVTAAAAALTLRVIDCVKVAVTVAPSALLHQRARPGPPVLRHCERVEFRNGVLAQ